MPKALTITVNILSEEGWDQDVQFPAKHEVCGCCEGHGEIEGDTCPACDGLRVMTVIDEERADPEMFASYLLDRKAAADVRAEIRAERRAFALDA